MCTVNNFNFLDNGLAMQIKTDCSPHLQSEDDQTTPKWMKHYLGNGTHFNVMRKSFKFCHSGTTCCSTGPLPVQNQRCKQTNYKAYELGSCGKFDFGVKELSSGDIRLHGPTKVRGLTFFDLTKVKKAWKPEWVKLFLGNGTVIKCSFDEIMVCKPEGKMTFALGILKLGINSISK